MHKSIELLPSQAYSLSFEQKKPCSHALLRDSQSEESLLSNLFHKLGELSPCLTYTGIILTCKSCSTTLVESMNKKWEDRPFSAHFYVVYHSYHIVHKAFSLAVDTARVRR